MLITPLWWPKLVAATGEWQILQSLADGAAERWFLWLPIKALDWEPKWRLPFRAASRGGMPWQYVVQLLRKLAASADPALAISAIRSVITNVTFELLQLMRYVTMDLLLF
jgi:hypothetical protein